MGHRVFRNTLTSCKNFWKSFVIFVISLEYLNILTFLLSNISKISKAFTRFQKVHEGITTLLKSGEHTFVNSFRENVCVLSLRQTENHQSERYSSILCASPSLLWFSVWRSDGIAPLFIYHFTDEFVDSEWSSSSFASHIRQKFRELDNFPNL